MDDESAPKCASGTSLISFRPRRRRSAGFAATELVASISLLLLPGLLLVVSLPRWSDRRSAAVSAARAVVRAEAVLWPTTSDEAARQAVAAVAAEHGMPISQLHATVRSSNARGGQIEAIVSVVMPRVWIPFVGGVGAWTTTVIAGGRIDDYRSR